MSNEMMQQILDRINVPAAKLGITAQYLWGVLLRQAYVTAYMDIASAVIALFFAVAGAVSIKHALRYCCRYYGDWPLAGLMWLGVSSLSCLLGTLIGLDASFKAITILFNPTFWALQQILK